jgi:hypothetical protein
MHSAFRTARPSVGDYVAYYEKYVSLVPDGDIVATLASIRSDTLAVLHSVSESQSMFAYAPGKWNIKEMLGHVIDAERVFGYRALWFARNNVTPLPSMEQDDFVKFGNHAQRPWMEIVAEYDHLRSSTIDLFESFDQAAWLRRGVASGVEVSVRGLAWNIAGHDLHHRAILKSKYLQK